MEVYQIVIIALLAISVLGLIVLFIIKYFKSEQIREEADFVINLDANQGSGRAFGRVINVEIGPENQEIITYIPQDLSLKEIMDNVEVKPVVVIGNKGKVLTLTKGFHSQGRYIKIVVPPTPDDFSDELKNQFLGRALQFAVGLSNADNATIESYKQGMLAVESATEKMSAGEVSKKEMLHFIGLMKDEIELLIREPKKDKQLSITPSFGQHST